MKFVAGPFHHVARSIGTSNLNLYSCIMKRRYGDQINRHHIYDCKLVKYAGVQTGTNFMPLSKFVERFSGFQAGHKEHGLNISVVGRIYSIRFASKSLFFIDILRDNVGIQIVVSKRYFEEANTSNNTSTKATPTTTMEDLKQSITMGDIVSWTGFPGKTMMGETSLFASSFQLLTPNLGVIPHRPGLKNLDIRHSQRYLDMLSNAHIYERFKKRSQILQFLRDFMLKRDFIEVETPILSPLAGGAIAKPFKTHMESLDLALEMRISPELYLKKWIIGGFDKVFEMGKQFRNEGVDTTHNPEFTSLEFYQTYTTVPELMQLTEELFSDAIECFNSGTFIITLDNGEELDIGGPFQKIDIIPFLEKKLQWQIYPHLSDEKSLLNSYKEKFPSSSLSFENAADLIDKLVSTHIEPLCKRPTFLVGHPLLMSPLAKAEDSRPLIADRFELIIDGKELVNAYSELNDPKEQRLRFSQQKGQSSKLHPMEEEFCKALEFGLPPTCGWGLGVDRFVMLLTGQTNIKEVIAFPFRR